MPVAKPTAENGEAIFDALLGPKQIRTMLHPIHDIQDSCRVMRR